MIKNKDRVPFIGLMEDIIEDNGMMVNNMEKDFF